MDGTRGVVTLGGSEQRARAGSVEGTVNTTDELLKVLGQFQICALEILISARQRTDTMFGRDNMDGLERQGHAGALPPSEAV